MLVGIGLILARKGLFANIVDRLVEFLFAIGLVGDTTSVARTPVIAHHVDGVGFTHIELGVIDGTDGARIDDRDLHLFSTDAHGEFLVCIFKPELEGNILFGVAIIVDMDLVQGIFIKLIKVRPALRILEGNVVGQKRHIPLSTSFITAKHIKVRAVHLRQTGNKRTLAMTRCVGLKSQGACYCYDKQASFRDQTSI